MKFEPSLMKVNSSLRLYTFSAIALTLLISLSALFLLISAGKKQDSLTELHLEHSKQLRDLEIVFMSLAPKSRSMGFSDSEPNYGEIYNLRAQFDHALHQLRSKHNENDWLETLEAVNQAHSSYQKSVDKLFILNRTKQSLRMRNQFFESEVSPKRIQVAQLIKEAILKEQGEFHSALRDSRRARTNATIALAVIGTLAFLLGFAFFAILSRMLRRNQNIKGQLAVSEELSEQAIRIGGLGVFDHDHLTDKIFWTDRVKEIFGEKSEGLISLEAMTGRIHPDDKERVWQAIKKAHDPKGDGKFELEHRIISSNKVKWVNVCSRTYFKDGVSVRTRGIISDVTAKKNIQLKLEKSNRELEQFAGVAAHDLSAPLKSMYSWIDVLDDVVPTPRSPEAEQAISFIRQNSKRADEMVTNLLEFARMNRKSTSHADVDLNEILNHLLAVLDGDISSAQAKIKFEELPQVKGNPHALESVFSNLLRNALTYRNPKGKAEILIGALEREGFYEFSVRDNGIGIDEANLKTVFEMFKRLHNQDEYPGTGIGLAFCKRVVENYGGKIWVESALGKGSTFYFTYPKSMEA